MKEMMMGYGYRLGLRVIYLDDRGQPVGPPGTVTGEPGDGDGLTVTYDDGVVRHYRRDTGLLAKLKDVDPNHPSLPPTPDTEKEATPEPPQL